MKIVSILLAISLLILLLSTALYGAINIYEVNNNLADSIYFALLCLCFSGLPIYVLYEEYKKEDE